MVKNHLVKPNLESAKVGAKVKFLQFIYLCEKNVVKINIVFRTRVQKWTYCNIFSNGLGQSHFTLLLEAARGIVINNNSQKIVKIQLNIKCLRQLESQNLLQYDELVINKEKDDQKSKKDFLISCIRNAINDHSLQINMQTWTEMRSLLFPNPVTDLLTVYTLIKTLLLRPKNYSNMFYQLLMMKYF